MIVPKKTGIVFVTIGTVLILSALLLFFYNQNEDERAGQEAQTILNDVQAAINQRETEKPEPSTVPTVSTEPEETEPSELTVVMIDGYEYIGYLSIPDLELELPVMADWDYERLKLAPCRQFGSTRTDDLVIAAHNYKRHFGALGQLTLGARIYFTDMDGNAVSYLVEKSATIDPKAVDAVQNSGYDLVLYTCTYGGSNRVAVFCNREASVQTDENE